MIARSLATLVQMRPDDSAYSQPVRTVPDENALRLTRISLNGSIEEFSSESVATGNAVSMTVGADGNFYKVVVT